MAGLLTHLLTLATLWLLASGLSIYQPDPYGSYSAPSYQTYDRRLIDAFSAVARPVRYSAYETPLYGAQKEYQPASYGTQTRAGYGAVNSKPRSLVYPLTTIRQPFYGPIKDDYVRTESYTPNIYDPCNGLPEGDYALQGDFVQLFPGIDAQCNFVKCANYKAYVNPCSVGTKNGVDGGPDVKYGFCATLDYDHYCGLYPASSDPYSRR